MENLKKPNLLTIDKKKLLREMFENPKHQESFTKTEIG